MIASHGGAWQPAFVIPGEEDNLFWSGFTFDWVAGAYSRPNYDCIGVCPIEYPYLLAFNNSSPADSANISATKDLVYGAFDLYDTYFACNGHRISVNATTGEKTEQLRGRDCKITATGRTLQGEDVQQDFDYKVITVPPEEGEDYTYEGMGFFTFSDEWRDVTNVFFNATVDYDKDFESAPTVYIDIFRFGGWVVQQDS
ncbi:hypothetical protein FH972_025806 [Carpinus fangiana]|uniref:Uncharacterized protein n=1 Tax=Carpinus fangiana TaxID=176857 RepID=A0A5N6L232_9ROSI|nr:hypothetical protein FH972_025806 [Carpinus fangiana]